MRNIDNAAAGVGVAERADGIAELSHQFKDSRPVIWARYTWILRTLRADRESVVSQLRSARQQELQIVLRVVLASYASDPSWRPLMQIVERRIPNRVRTTLGCGHEVIYVVAESEGRIVGVSGVARLHWSGQNFLTGICLLPDARHRRLGTALLASSLECLRLMGVSEATAYAKVGSRDDREHFPLFGSSREEGVPWEF